MDKLLTWVSKHKVQTGIVIVIVFLAPLLIVHFAFPASGNYIIETTLSSGEVLAYIAGFETLLGTLILGYVSIYQNKQAQKTNDSLQRLQQAQFISMVSVLEVMIEPKSSSTPKFMNTKMRELEIIDLTMDQFSSAQSYHVDVRFKNDSNYPIVQLLIHPGAKTNGNCQLFGLKNLVEWATYIPGGGEQCYRFIIPCEVFEALNQYSCQINVGFVNVFDYITPSSLYITDFNRSEYQYRLSKFTDIRPK